MKRTMLAALGVAAALAAWGVVGCARPADPWEEEPGSPRIVVTIAPLASLVRGVGGDRPAIKCLCTTTGPHHFSPDTRDSRVLGKADLFLAIGLRLDDSFADGMRAQARRDNLRFVKLGNLLDSKSLMELKHDHDHGDGDHDHKHGKWDPHVWLGLPEMIAMAGEVGKQLCEIDPDHAAEYRKNAEAYTAKLKALHEEGKKLLQGKKLRRLISFHEALGYFARSFDLEIADVIEQGPGDEPSGTHLAKIVKLCTDEKRPIAAITVEPQYPKSTSAVTVQRELRDRKVKIDLIEIDPLETADPKELHQEGAGWYEARMRKNLETLASKLP